MRDSVVIMRNWIEQVESLCNEEQLRELCYNLLKYGLYEEYIESKDPAVNMALRFITPQIDAMQEDYQKKIASGAKGGKACKVDNEKIWKMARDGISGGKIAEELGLPRSTVYSSAGWRAREKEQF